MDELVDYYDQDGQVIGQCSREEAEDKNYTTPNAIIFVFTPDNKVIIQKRAQSKKHYPGLWDVSACGGLSSGEDALAAAERELFEEIGIRCKLHFVERFMNSFPDETGRLIRCRYSHLYVGVAEPDTVHNHEVESVAVFPIAELEARAKERPQDFIPSFALELQKCAAFYTTSLRRL
jgi:8-oxo-dGTP pyrophosphatase MutT (NUDIX family)